MAGQGRAAHGAMRCAALHDRASGDRLFVDAILEGRQVSPSFTDGLKAQEVIDAAIESHHNGTWVSLKPYP